MLQTFLIHLTTQLRNLTNRVYEFSTLAVNNRIEAELLRLAQSETSASETLSSSMSIKRLPSHAEIANNISTHREAVTRHLVELSRQGLIERKGKALIIKDPEQFSRRVEGMAFE